MIVARSPSELEPAARAVALGTFDGVHRGHRAVIDAVKAAGLRSTVLTFDPHPRLVLGYDVQLLTTFERRLELLEEAGPDEVLIVEFTQELSRSEPEAFAAEYLAGIGAEVVVAGEDFRFGAGRRGDVALLRSLGLEVRPVPLLAGVSSSRIRELVQEGDLPGAAALLGRPFELEGDVVYGDRRGGTLGFPTANLAPHRARARPCLRHLRGRGARTPGGCVDRRQSALRRQRAPDRGVPARLRGRPVREPPPPRALGASA